MQKQRIIKKLTTFILTIALTMSLLPTTVYANGIIDNEYYKYFGGIIPGVSKMACLANEPWHFTISSAGEIYRCTERLGTKTCIVGDVINGITNTDIEDTFMTNKLYDRCYNCNCLPSCLGKCTVERIIENKGINCDAVRERTIDKFKTLYQL